MTKLLRLSYDIQENMPLYPGTPEPLIKREKDIESGGSCNTFVFTLSNHSGTHVDAPRHFYQKAKSISEYSIGEFVFKKPVILNCPKKQGEAVVIADLLPLQKIPDCDIVLLKTGFSRYRDTDPVTYCQRGPYLSPEAALWLRNECTHVKAVGIDAISIASYTNREAGLETHRTLLAEQGFPSPAILIIEDMIIPDVILNLVSVLVVPFFLKDVDSAPCTVIGSVE